MARNVSKSRYQKGLQCEKALWLAMHRGDLAEPPSEAQQWIFSQGHEVGLVARKLFPGGVEVADDYLHPAEALESTARLLAEGATVLYEPAFSFGGGFVRADILVATGDGRWDLYEVKSSKALKDIYITDAAFQAYVIEGSGLTLRTIAIVRLDSAYLHGGDGYDPRKLFAIDDITDMARQYMPSVPGVLEQFAQVLAGDEPEVRIGQQCSQPYPCDFAGYCRAFLPKDFPVTGLPRLTQRQLHALLDEQITSILQVPDDWEHLSNSQREAVKVVKAGEPIIDLAGLARALEQIEWPVYHLDFETVNPALPLWANTRPYQVIPFQYSIHVHYPDGSTEHCEYLHRKTDDPRPALTERMLLDLGRSGSILHYTVYERTQLDALAEALPQFARSLASVRKRLIDLEPLIKGHAKHPASAGSSSIKHVLPAWCPDLSHAALAIGDGSTAGARYLRALKGLAPEEETEQIYRDLLEYCGLDTFGMVRLLEEMRRLVSEAESA